MSVNVWLLVVLCGVCVVCVVCAVWCVVCGVLCVVCLHIVKTNIVCGVISHHGCNWQPRLLVAEIIVPAQCQHNVELCKLNDLSVKKLLSKMKHQ